MQTSKLKRAAIGLAAACACLVVLGAVLVWAALPMTGQEPSQPRSDGLPKASDGARGGDSAVAWFSLEGDALSVEIDEDSVSYAEVYNYPTFGPSGTRSLNDAAAVKNLIGLVNGKTFTAAQSVSAWNKSREGYVGGYSSAVSFFDESGSRCGIMQFDPGFPGDGMAIIAQDTIYCMEGDQTALIDALDELVDRLRDEQPPQETGR